MSGSLNLYRSTPRQIRGHITECLFAGLVPFIRSSPGMGKSSIVRAINDDLNLKLIDHRLSTSEPTDMSGLPQFVDGKARFAPFDELFPIESSELPKGKDGWTIFFDEFNSAPKAVQAACYKTILDRMTGQHKLHENVVMICAGNLDTDRAITNPIGTAMQSRVVTLVMELSFQEWLEDVALKEGYDARIIAFLSMFESHLMDFRPDHKEHTFCCPRTWEFMNRLIKDKPVVDEKTALYAGTITSGVATEFVQFTKVFQNLVTVREILADPNGCVVPFENATRWATICHMLEKIDEKNFDGMATYASRFDLSFKILFFRSVLVRQPALKRHPAFAKAQLELSRYLNGV